MMRDCQKNKNIVIFGVRTQNSFIRMDIHYDYTKYIAYIKGDKL